ncbi:hypothetical protein L6452_26968 [Arctium lappa]|uniref:Uncharacterized protein n=1 Tax=Arctium lappa TaxID=4217 RepID=A0ACB8ZW34_ARCLA|nr:hypothetical protein L6452_26968 [Arctium lappa]
MIDSEKFKENKKETQSEKESHVTVSRPELSGDDKGVKGLQRKGDKIIFLASNIESSIPETQPDKGVTAVSKTSFEDGSHKRKEEGRASRDGPEKNFGGRPYYLHKIEERDGAIKNGPEFQYIIAKIDRINDGGPSRQNEGNVGSPKNGPDSFLKLDKIEKAEKGREGKLKKKILSAGEEIDCQTQKEKKIKVCK